MQIGELLLGGQVAFSPWFPRQADNAIFTYELIEVAASASPTFKVEVFSKNTEETGPGEEVGNLITWDTVDSNTSFKAARFLVSSPNFSGFEEMVRFKFSVTDPGLTLEGDPITLFAADIAWVRYRLLIPTWFDTVVV